MQHLLLIINNKRNLSQKRLRDILKNYCDDFDTCFIYDKEAGGIVADYRLDNDILAEYKDVIDVREIFHSTKTKDELMFIASTNFIRKNYEENNSHTNFVCGHMYC